MRTEDGGLEVAARRLQLKLVVHARYHLPPMTAHTISQQLLHRMSY